MNPRMLAICTAVVFGLLLITWLAIALIPGRSEPETQKVKGYQRKDGTVVQPYTRHRK